MTLWTMYTTAGIKEEFFFVDSSPECWSVPRNVSSRHPVVLVAHRVHQTLALFAVLEHAHEDVHWQHEQSCKDDLHTAEFRLGREEVP